MKILFISHEATRTGAPILLFRLIEQIKKYSGAEIMILLKEPGELEKDCEALGRTFVWNRYLRESLTGRLKKKIYHKTGLLKGDRTLKHKEAIVKDIESVDIVINNTLANTSLLKELPLGNKRIFTYVHELAIIARLVASKEEVNYLDSISEKIFVPSNAVKNFLAEEYGINATKIDIIKSILPAQNKLDGKFLAEIKKINAARDKEFLVGFCGTSDWRKGFELLPLLIRKIVIERKVRDIHFVWIGVNKQAYSYMITTNDLQKLHLEDYVSLIEPEPEIANYLAQLDVLVMPSREDAFPLVVLEAANFEVPCVYFEGAGGIGEFSGNDAGIGVDYLDIDAMAEAVLKLKSNEALRSSMGIIAKEKLVDFSNAEKIVKGLLESFKN